MHQIAIAILTFLSPELTFFLVTAGVVLGIAILLSLFEAGTKYLWRKVVKEYINRFLLYRPLLKKFKIPLQQHFKYYNQLSDKDKHLFERRVQKFIDTKEFIPRGDLQVVTPEMKALIAATAIQVTFGYPHVYFEHFWRIMLHPDTYYSQITQNFHKGEVNLRGAIILSWVSFVEGFVQDKSGINLGYHEMAHALHFENAIENGEYEFIDDTHLKHFHQLADTEIQFMRQGNPSFFRNYAATNHHEFFAVVVENFFERPREFHEYRPDLYLATVNILKQDPLQPRVRL